MTSLDNDGSTRQDTAGGGREEAKICDDEIYSMGYFRIIWKRRYLILAGSLLPTLLAGLFFYLSPQTYKISLRYDVQDHFCATAKSANPGKPPYYNFGNWNLNKYNYDMYLDDFFGDENTDRIESKYPEYEHETVSFDVWPSYPDLSNIKTTDFAHIKRFRETTPQLLFVNITHTSESELSKAVPFVRDNIENAIPLSLIKTQIADIIKEYKMAIATIDENLLNAKNLLKTNTNILPRLKNLDLEPSSEQANRNVVLQFDIGEKVDYLPLSYQIEIMESQIIRLTEQINEKEELHGYMEQIVALNTALLEELTEKQSITTIGQFRKFLMKLLTESEGERLSHFLRGYIQKTENLISNIVPVNRRVKITVLHNSPARKCAIVFVVSLMISLFTAFLLESVQNVKVKFP